MRLIKKLDARDIDLKAYVKDCVKDCVKEYVTNNFPTSNSNENAMVENINKQMRKQLYQMDQTEQNSRGDNVIIKGLVEESSENLQQNIIYMVKGTDVTLDPSDIKAHYRLGGVRTSPGRFPRPVMVQLNNRDKRTKIMIGKKKLAAGQFIEEDLTKLRSRMYFEVRKHEHTTKTWTINGVIYAIVKGKNGVESKEQFSTPDDLYKLGWNKDKLDAFLEPQ